MPYFLLQRTLLEMNGLEATTTSSSQMNMTPELRISWFETLRRRGYYVWSYLVRKQKHIVRIHTYRSLYYQILHRETLKSTLIIITQYYLSDKVLQNRNKTGSYYGKSCG